jgi:hypothetical protein
LRRQEPVEANPTGIFSADPAEHARVEVDVRDAGVTEMLQWARDSDSDGYSFEFLHRNVG